MNAPLMTKICGLSTEEAVQTARDHGATHLGFIFFEKSPRNVSPERAGELAALKGDAKSVAVTVNADDAAIDDIVAAMNPDMIQLHGRETPERCREVKRRTGRDIIKAFAVREATDLDAIAAFDGAADMLLLDAKPPADADLPGGNGITFDWSVLDALNTVVPVLLSGGVGAHNLDEALATIRGNRSLAGIDLSSGVESAPGVKDAGAIARLLDRVSAA